MNSIVENLSINIILVLSGTKMVTNSSVTYPKTIRAHSTCRYRESEVCDFRLFCSELLLIEGLYLLISLLSSSVMFSRCKYAS